MLENFRFKKSLGQNFLSDANFLNAIVADADVSAHDDVLEIGAGAGALTQALSAKARHVLAIEKDEELRGILTERFENAKNVQIVFGDFLKMNKGEIEKNLNKPYKIVANLPYYITTPIIFKIIEDGFAAGSVTVMVQKEVADRLRAKPGTKDYGVITVKLNLVANISVVRLAPRALFYPVPNVDSAIVKIDFKKDTPKETGMFSKVVDAAFRERRKMLAGNLARAFSLQREAVDAILMQEGISPGVRGEALTCDQFLKISQKIAKM